MASILISGGVSPRAKTHYTTDGAVARLAVAVSWPLDPGRRATSRRLSSPAGEVNSAPAREEVARHLLMAYWSASKAGLFARELSI